jgi:hypothetical protein
LRRASLAYLGKPGRQQREALDAERQKTDALAAAFKESARNWQTDLAGSAQLQQRIDEMIAGLDGLSATRAAVDGQSVDRPAAANTFTDVLDSIFRVYDSLGNLDDPQISKDTAALIEINRARELMSQEDALLSGALAAGRITVPEQAKFAQLVGAQRFLAGRTVAVLPAADRARYEQLVGRNERIRVLEDR